jgi:hypothetical protein
MVTDRVIMPGRTKRVRLMTHRELKEAERLLSDLTDRTESVVLDGGGQAITAYWLEGGQTLFYDLDTLREHLFRVAEQIEHAAVVKIVDKVFRREIDQLIEKADANRRGSS